MTVTVYNIAKLYWTARNGASEMRQGNAAIMAKRLETLRCPARLVLLDGTLIGGCQRTDGSQTCKRLKWAWWYDKEALISHTEPTRAEVERVRAEWAYKPDTSAAL